MDITMQGDDGEVTITITTTEVATTTMEAEGDREGAEDQVVSKRIEIDLEMNHGNKIIMRVVQDHLI